MLSSSVSHLEQCSSASAGPTRPGTAGQEMLPWLGLDDVVLVVVSSALVCCTCFVAPALLLLMTATATTLPEPTLTDAAPPPPLPSCACPAYEFILCNCSSTLAKFRTKLSGRIKLPDRQMRLWPLRGRLAWQILPPDRETESRSPIPNSQCEMRRSELFEASNFCN